MLWRRAGVCIKRVQNSGDFLVSWIRVEDAAVPSTCRLTVSNCACDVTEMPKRDEVFGVEGEGGLEDAACLIVTTRLEESLTVHDVPTHVYRLLRKKFLADENRLLEITDFAVFIRERRKITTRILVKFFPELVNARRTGH